MNETTRSRLEQILVDLILAELKLYGNNRAWFERVTGISEANVRRWQKGASMQVCSFAVAVRGVAKSKTRIKTPKFYGMPNAGREALIDRHEGKLLAGIIKLYMKKATKAG